MIKNLPIYQNYIASMMVKRSLWVGLFTWLGIHTFNGGEGWFDTRSQRVWQCKGHFYWIVSWPKKMSIEKERYKYYHILKVIYLNNSSFVSALINSVLANFFNCWSVHQKWRKRHSPCCSSSASSSLTTFKELIGLL